MITMHNTNIVNTRKNTLFARQSNCFKLQCCNYDKKELYYVRV